MGTLLLRAAGYRQLQARAYDRQRTRHCADALPMRTTGLHPPPPRFDVVGLCACLPVGGRGHRSVYDHARSSRGCEDVTPPGGRSEELAPLGDPCPGVITDLGAD
jgi:hypothetical protein